MIGLVAAVGFAAEMSQCVYLCGLTFRDGDRGATNDMLVQSLRLQCGARAAHAAGRENFVALNSIGEPRWLESTTQLIRAAILNNLPRVLQLVQLGAPLDLCDKTWFLSALHFACLLGHDHIAKALLDGKYEGRGATIDKPSDFSMTPLILASLQGREDIVRLLLSYGADQELKDHEDFTALHWAVLEDHPGVVELLCSAPGAAAALAIRNWESITPLKLAIFAHRAACEAVLRAHGAPE